MERTALRLSPRTLMMLRELVAAQKLLRWQTDPSSESPTQDKVLREALLAHRIALGRSLQRHGVDWEAVNQACDREYRRRTGQPSPEDETDDRADQGTEVCNFVDDDED